MFDGDTVRCAAPHGQVQYSLARLACTCVSSAEILGLMATLVAVISTLRGEQPTLIWGTGRDDRLSLLAKGPYLHPSSSFTDK